MTSRPFAEWRRTGPLSAAEQTALRPIADVHPRPAALPMLFKRFEAVASFPFGIFHLQDRGWLRVRGGYVSLTSRWMVEAAELGHGAAVTLLPSMPVERSAERTVREGGLR